MKVLIIPLIILFSFFNVYANTITFVDYGLSSQEIDIYFSNGSKLDTVTSNGSIVLDSSTDYQFAFRPQKIDILNNPMLLFIYLKNGLGVLIVIGLLIFAYKHFK